MALRRGGTKQHDPEIVEGMARGPWASYWASQAEEAGESLPGVDVYEAAPPTPAWAKRWARALAHAVVEANGSELETLYQAALTDGFPHDAESFGALLGLQATGSGVSWRDDVKKTALMILLPRTEFYQGATIDSRFVRPA